MSNIQYAICNIRKLAKHIFFLTLLSTGSLWLLAQKIKHSTVITELFGEKIKTDVLVIGGGASGVCAAIQAARMGVKVVLVEETTWLGGMLTAAGVSAIDGNHNMPSGLFGEFREQLYKVYGGSKQVETGWVSNTHFEPHVGDSILKAMVAKEKNITVLYSQKMQGLMFSKSGDRISAISFVGMANKEDGYQIAAKQIIDASELGEVMAIVGVNHNVGMEASTATGEDTKIPETNMILQDLTYCAILKDYGKGIDKTITKPENYDPLEFDGCNKEYASSPEKLLSNISAQKMLDYAKLPNNKYLINWPNKGNDTYVQYIDSNTRSTITWKQIEKAKQKTLRFIYFIQTQLGYSHLSLADDEFPTTDKLPLIPYYRESRRLDGMVRLKVQQIAKPYESNLYKTGIAVGDYPIDHHHREQASIPKDLGFYPIPSYNIPLGCLVPKSMKGLIVAEKSISVSNVVNGTTRLQPVVMQIGQAAGALAAICSKKNIDAQNVNVRDVQQALLKAKGYIMPFYDVKPSHKHWESVQKIGATGILRGVGEPYKWANRTWFYPDSLVNGKEVVNGLIELKGQKLDYNTGVFTVEDAIFLVNMYNIRKKKYLLIDEKYWKQIGLTNFNRKRNITRMELALLFDKALNIFFEVPK